MNKKVIIGIIAALVVVGVSIYAINNNSKSNNDTSSKIAESANNTENNDSENNDSDSDSNSETTQNFDSNSEDSTTSNDTVSNDETATTLEELDAAANAEIASDQDKAIKKLIDYYLGIDNTFMPNTTKVKLVTNSDNTITISKTDEDSNVYYTGKDPLSDNVSDGLILTIEGYNEAEKIYTYSIKDYSDVKSGNTTKVEDSGTVPERGAVTSNSKK